MIGPCERPLMFELTQAAELERWKGNSADPAWQAFVVDVRRFVAREASAPQPANDRAMTAATRPRHVLRYALPLGVLLLGAVAWLLLPQAGKQAATRAVESVVARDAPVSIAVLPFVDMTEQGNDTSLGDGLAEEISNWLAQIPDMHVVARTSSFTFRGANQDVRKVGRALDATHVVEGSIRRGGDKVRVTVQLVAAADGYHVWSRTFDLPDTNALHIEDVVSRSVAEALNARLSDETERRWKVRGAQLPQAHDLYLEGRAELKRLAPEHNLRAMDLLRRSIEEDRNFPLSYVSLAEATMYSVELQGRPLEQVAAEVTTLLDKAEALSPGLPESIGVRGWLALRQYRTEEAVTLLKRAVSLNPNDAEAQRRLGMLYVRLAQPRQAEKQFLLSSELDPLDFMTHVRRCMSLQDLAEFTAAEEACERARELDPENIWGPQASANLAFGQGDFVGSLRWLDRMSALDPKDTQVLDQRVWLLLQLGLFDEAVRTVARLPDSASPQREFLNASIAIARQDQSALAAALVALIQGSGEFGMLEWLELARLQLVSGDATAAKVSLEKARKAPDWQPAYQSRPEFVRLGNSNSIFIAAIEMAVGNREAGLQQLDSLDATLDKLEQDGGACGGLHSLRAASQALRGDPDGAMASLLKAHDKGWRESPAARIEPYLQSLRDRQDFRHLLAMTDRELQVEAATFETSPQ
jgi:TolB-like protein/tetratricopeptide (TPR) repeat protein